MLNFETNAQDVLKNFEERIEELINENSEDKKAVVKVKEMAARAQSNVHTLMVALDERQQKCNDVLQELSYLRTKLHAAKTAPLLQ